MTFRVTACPLSGIVPLPTKVVIAAAPLPIVFDRIITTRRKAGVYMMFEFVEYLHVLLSIDLPATDVASREAVDYVTWFLLS